MTASEAKELATKHILQDTEGEYQRIMKQISEHATRGSFNTTIYTLHELVKARLVQDGYEVKYYAGDSQDQRERSYYSISWK